MTVENEKEREARADAEPDGEVLSGQWRAPPYPVDHRYAALIAVASRLPNSAAKSSVGTFAM
jgi:hypothetical protein